MEEAETMTPARDGGHRVPARHFLLALAVVAVWGTNFVVIHHGLEQFPPFTFAALRFLLAVVPAIFLVARPSAPMARVAVYGVLIGLGQFGLLYLAIDGLITPGLASLVIQVQVFFTIALAALVSKERIRRLQWAALGLCAVGLVIIAAGTGGSASFAGLALVIAAAASWACANIVGKSASGERMLSFIVWSSLFAVPPLMIVALLVEGPARMADAVATADAGAWASLIWQSAGNSLFGYAAWSWLLTRHPAAYIVPTALLVPVFGLTASAVLLGEPMQAWKLAATAVIIGGLGINFSAPLLERIFPGRAGAQAGRERPPTSP